MIKQRVKQALLGSGLLRLAGKLRPQGAAILMYHSVLEDPGRVRDSLGAMIHSRSVFAGQMELIARLRSARSVGKGAAFGSGGRLVRARGNVNTYQHGQRDELIKPIG